MSDQLNLELTVKSALALLTYLYTGELTLTASFQAELIKFSEQFAVPELLALCHKLQPAADKEFDKSDDSAQEMEVDDDMNKTKLDVMLKEIWGESDSDSDHSDVFNDSKSDSSSKQDHDLRSSQKQRLEIERLKEDVQNSERSDQILNDKSANSMTDLSETDSIQESDYKNENNNLIDSNACLIDDIDVKNDDNFRYLKNENEITSPNHVIGDGSPQPKRQKINCSPDCDISNISENNVLKDTSKDKTKELAFCGVSFDSSFTRLPPSPNEKSDENVIVSRQLDSSSADLFESPSPKLSQKPLFKPTEKETVNDFQSQNNKLESSPTKAPKNISPRIDDIVMKETGSVKDDSIIIDDDDDDLEITGDNFAELSQPSPTFGDTKCKNSVFSKTSVSASACNAEALKMSDKYTEKQYDGAVNEDTIKGLDSAELHEKSISEEHGDDINSEIDLHNFSFNDSFNEHFDSGEQNRSVSDALNLSSCDKNNDKNSVKSVVVTSDNRDKGDGLRKHSSIVVLEIDSDHSDPAQELGSEVKVDEYEKKSPKKTDTKCSEAGSEASNSQNGLSGAGCHDDSVSESMKEKQGKHSQNNFSEGNISDFDIFYT